MIPMSLKHSQSMYASMGKGREGYLMSVESSVSALSSGRGRGGRRKNERERREEEEK